MPPLKPGHDDATVHHNIKEMIKAGHPQKQAIAAALANARKSKKMADGGQAAPIDPDKAKSAQDSMRKAFNFAEGGTAKYTDPNGESGTTPDPDSGYTSEEFNAHMDGDMAPNAPEETHRKIVEQAYLPDTDRADNRNSRGEQVQASFAGRDNVENPQEQKAEMSLAEAIRKASDETDIQHFAEGGLVQEEFDDEPNGNKPMQDTELAWINNGTEQPMSMMPSKPSASKTPPAQPGNNLHPDVYNVILERKKKRSYNR